MHTLKKSVQYKGKYYKANETIKIDNKDLDEFKRRDLICDASKSVVSDFKDKGEEVVKEEVKTHDIDEEIDYNQFTVNELKIMLDNKGIEYKSSDIKGDLIKLLRGE